jgi:hypothetical protein
VISADLPALGRLTPGAEVRFSPIDIEAAEALRRQLAAEMAALARRMLSVPGEVRIDPAALETSNLVSGMIDALGEG